MNINSSDLTILVQGPFEKDITPQTFSSIRKIFPNTPIVFSTWEGTQIPSLENPPDKIIFNKDPKACFHANLNRQIYSTSEGLKLVETKYVMKIRSDFIIKNANALKLATASAPRKHSIFEERLIAYVWKPVIEKKNKRLFHPGDFYYLGLTSDLKKLFSIPLVPEQPEVVYASAEHHLWLTFVNSHTNINVTLDDLKNLAKRKYFNEILADNFIFANYFEMGVKTLKTALKKNNIQTSQSAFKFKDWLKISGSSQKIEDFPETKVPTKEFLRTAWINFCARFSTLFCTDKQKRQAIRASFYEKL